MGEITHRKEGRKKRLRRERNGEERRDKEKDEVGEIMQERERREKVQGRKL